MIMINKINNLSQSEFIEIFANIFEKTKWIAERAYNPKPFDNFEILCSKMLEIFKILNKILKIITVPFVILFFSQFVRLLC